METRSVNPPSSPLRLFTLQQASAETGIPLSTLYRLKDAHAIPCVRFPANGARGRVYVRASDLRAWIDAHTTPAVAPRVNATTPVFTGRQRLS